MSSNRNDIANYGNEDMRDIVSSLRFGRASNVFCPKDEPVSQQTYKCMPGKKNDEKEGTSLKQALFQLRMVKDNRGKSPQR